MGVINALVSCIVQCFSWFDYLMNEFGMLPLWLGVFVIYTINRFILQPITGAFINAGASDYVKKYRNKQK